MIDLVSDTKSQPTPGMRAAMANAVVGDEQYHEDPTTLKLCDRVAKLLGKASAIFLPSGTMCNEISIRVHCQPGDELIVSSGSHIVRAEAGGPAALSGVTTRALDGARGIFSAEQLEAAIRPPSRYVPRSRMVSIEQSAGYPSGAVWRPGQLAAIVEVATHNNLKLHMDGARLANAATALNLPMQSVCQGFDSVWLDLSKGLGAPVGAVLAGDEEFISTAWRFKQQWGGAMRQSGVLAAAGLYALDHNLARLAQDHANAATLAIKLAEIDDVLMDASSVETNIVYFDISRTGVTAADFVNRLKDRGVLMGASGSRLIRAVTHIGVDEAMVLNAARCVREVAEQIAMRASTENIPALASASYPDG